MYGQVPVSRGAEADEIMEGVVVVVVVLPFGDDAVAVEAMRSSSHQGHN